MEGRAPLRECVYVVICSDIQVVSLYPTPGVLLVYAEMPEDLTDTDS